MATATSSARPGAARAAQPGYPAGGLRFDWAFIGLSIIFIAGLWVDAWAHFHAQVDASFFTPWHFLFYSAFGMTALFTGVNQWRNLNKGYAFRRALPEGYWLALVGVMIFSVGGVGDMIWHTLFGIETGSEALTSPSHITLAVGMCLVFTGPLRAAWLRGNVRGWRNLGPAIVSAALLLTMLAFFTSYAHPLVNPVAAGSGGEIEQVRADSQIYVMNADGTAQTLLVAERGKFNFAPVYSPDGTQIIFVRSSGQPDVLDSDLYRMNADGSNITSLTSVEGAEYAADWSPDGTKIAYIHETDSLREIFVMNADGSGEPVQITDNSDSEWPLHWSPDGTQLIYGIDNGGDFTIIDADGGNARVVSPGMRAWQPIWTRDGSKIIFSASDAGGTNVYSMNLDGSGVTKLSLSDSFDAYPMLSSDGQQISFTSWRSGMPELYVMPLTGETADQPAVNLSKNTALEPNESAWSPDGSKILFSATGRQAQDSGNNFESQDFGIGSILLQAGLMIGVILLMAWRWRLPFGAVTLILVFSTFMLTLLNDFYVLTASALVAGLVADLLLWRLKPSPANEAAFHLFAFVVPTVFFALYFLTLQLLGGLGWNIHVWGGAIFMSGMLGLLASYLMTGAARSVQTQG